jgi:hypothetical protein
MATTKRPDQWWLYSDQAMSLGLQGGQGQDVVVGGDQAGHARRVALDDLLDAHAVGAEIDRGGDGGEGGGGEEDAEANADFGFGEAPEADDLAAVAGAQARDRAEIAVAEGEQHQEQTDLGADHHAIGGAVEAGDVADEVPGQHAAAGQDGGDPEGRHAGEPLADHGPGGALVDAGEGGDEGGDAADPQGGAELVEASGGEEDLAVFDPRRGMGGRGAGGQDHHGEGEQDHARGAAAGDHGEEQSGGDLGEAGLGEGGGEDFGDRQIDGADQHRAVEAEAAGFGEGQGQGAPADQAQRVVLHGDAGAADQPAERAGEEEQEQHAADRDGLPGDHQAVDDDGEVAEQVDQKAHG